MDKVFMLRHQSGGFLSQFVLREEPTAEQLAHAMAWCCEKFGGEHPKSGERYWLRVVEVPVIDEAELIPLSLQLDQGRTSNVVDIHAPTLDAVGHVSEKKG